MKKEKIITFLLIFLIIYFPLAVIVKNSGININEFSDFQIDKQLQFDDYCEVYGYNIKNNYFVENENDPRIMYNDINMDIESIQIILEKPLEKTLGIQVYYVAEGCDLLEPNSVFAYAHKGDTDIYIDVPKVEKCDILRFDLNGEFVLEKINLSQSDFIVTNIGKSQVSFWAYIIMVLIALCISGILIFKIDLLTILNEKKNSLKKFRFNTIVNKRTVFCFITIIIYFIILLVIKQNLYVNKYKFVFWITLVSAVVVLVIQGRKLREHIAGVTFALIILGGICYIYTLPIATLVGPDDEIHYERAVYMSHLFDKTCSEADEMIYNRKVLIDYDQENIKQRSDKLEQLYINGKSFEITPTSTNIFERMAYIPMAIAMLVARGLECSFIHIFMMGKFANLLMYAILVYLSIRKLKSGKLILSVIALLPTNIFLACSYSYDVCVTGFSMYAIAYIISLIQDRDAIVSKQDIIILSAFIIGYSPKAIYFPMVLLTLIIPKNHFKNKRCYKMFVSAVIACAIIVMASFMLPFVVEGPGEGDARGGSDVNSKEQVEFILTNPIEYTNILFNHLKSYLSIERQDETIADFAYMGRTNHFALLLSVLIIAACIDRRECDMYINNLKSKIFCLGLIFITVVLISTALYVSFTPVALPRINGCQYRYLMPLIFPIMYFVFNTKIDSKANRNILYAICLSLLMFVLYDDAWRLWVDSYEITEEKEIEIGMVNDENKVDDSELQLLCEDIMINSIN